MNSSQTHTHAHTQVRVGGASSATFANTGTCFIHHIHTHRPIFVHFRPGSYHQRDMMAAPESEMRQLFSMRDRLLTVIQRQGGSPPIYSSATTPAELQEEIQELLRHAKQSLVTTSQSSQRSNPEGCAARRRLQLALCQNARYVQSATLIQPHQARDSPTDLFSYRAISP